MLNRFTFSRFIGHYFISVPTAILAHLLSAKGMCDAPFEIKIDNFRFAGFPKTVRFVWRSCFRPLWFVVIYRISIHDFSVNKGFFIYSKVFCRRKEIDLGEGRGGVESDSHKYRKARCFPTVERGNEGREISYSSSLCCVTIRYNTVNICSSLTHLE